MLEIIYFYTCISPTTVIAMLVLVVEVFYYRKKATKTALVSNENEKEVKIFTTKINPFELNSPSKNSILLGPGHFIAADLNMKRKARFSPLTVRTRD